MNPLMDALEGFGYLADTPGAYLRGALSGKPGERASGLDLLSSYGLSSDDDPWGGLKGFGAEMVLDPLALAGPALGAIKGFQGIRAGTRAAGALTHADDLNPLARAVAGFAGDELGAIGHPRALELLRNPETPLGRMKALAEHTPAAISVDPVHQSAFQPSVFDAFGPAPGDLERAYAAFTPGWRSRPGGVTDPLVIPNLNYDEWGSNRLMSDLVSSAMGSKGHLPKPRGHLDYIPVHEFGHAFHDQLLNTAADLGHDLRAQPIFQTDPFAPLSGQYPWNIGPRLRRSAETRLGPRAIMNPQEFVAEAFADQVLGQTDLPRMLRGLYRDLGGPDVGMLPEGFWHQLRLTPRGPS